MNRQKLFTLASKVAALLPDSWAFDTNKSPLYSLWAEIKGPDSKVLVFRERIDQQGSLLIYGRRPPIDTSSAETIRKFTEYSRETHIPHVHASLNDSPVLIAELIRRDLLPVYHNFFRQVHVASTASKMTSFA